MRADDDQVGAPLLRLAQDRVSGRAGQRLEQHSARLESFLAHQALRIAQDPFAGLGHARHQLVDSARALDSHHGHVVLVGDMHELQRCALALGKANRLSQAGIRGRAAVHGDENSLVSHIGSWGIGLSHCSDAMREPIDLPQRCSQGQR